MKINFHRSIVESAKRCLPIIGIAVGPVFLSACESNGDLPPLATDEEMAEATDSPDMEKQNRGIATAPATDEADRSDQPLVDDASMPSRYRTIVIDGRFDDWQGIPPVVLTTASRSESASFGERMLRNANSVTEVFAAFDDEWVYLKLDRPTVSNLQAFDGTLRLELDLDGNMLTGVVRASRDERRPGLAGVDAQIDFSPRQQDGETSGVAAALLEKGAPPLAVNPYAFDASFAPTYASDVVEMRIRRGAHLPGANVDAFLNDSARARLVWFDANGRQTGFSDPFTIQFAGEDEMSASSDAETEADVDPYAWRLRPYRSVRIVSWNVERGSIFVAPDSYRRVLHALDPDVICFQELGDEATTDRLRDWLEKQVPTPDGWEVRVQPGTGTGIASKLSAVRTGPRNMPSVSNDGRPIRASMMIIGYDGRRIVLSNLHLTCCGRMGDSRDQRRVAEATTIRGLVADAVRTDDAVGFMHVGDLNLVGSREPLDILMDGTDLNGSNLLDAAPLRWNGTTNTTWRDPDQPFLPGRLDFVLVSDSTVRVHQAFVFETQLLDSEALGAVGLMPSDTTDASDHLPIVIDAQW